MTESAAPQTLIENHLPHSTSTAQPRVCILNWSRFEEWSASRCHWKEGQL